MSETRRSEKATAVAAWEALFRAQVAVMRSLNAEFPGDEISFNEYDVCFNLSTQPGRRCRMRDLTGHLLLTQPSVSRLVDRLLARGIVEKQPDPTDARGVIVALTPHGFDVYRRSPCSTPRASRSRSAPACPTPNSAPSPNSARSSGWRSARHRAGDRRPAVAAADAATA